MATQPETPEPAVNTTVKFELTKEDLVNIKHAELEEKLNNKLAEAEKQLREAQRTHERAKDELTAILESGIQGIPDRIKDLVDAVKALGNDVRNDSSVTLTTVDCGSSVTLSNGHTLQGPASADDHEVAFVRERHVVNWSRCSDSSHGSEGMHRDTVARVMTEREAEAREKVLDAEKAVTKTQGEILAIKQEIANLPALVRQARAAMARTVLERTADGRELMESVNGVNSRLLE
jgi:predicted  nucleic acid-binding Zn-ribbon protein